MRRSLPLLVLCACAGLRELTPAGPVLTAPERAAAFDHPAPSGVAYRGHPADLPPLLPVVPFGVTYDLDLVVRARHAAWDMHELALVRLPDGPVWLAKDADGALSQHLTLEDADVSGWWPEIPLDRTPPSVRVSDRSQGDALDLSLAWTTPDGEAAELSWEGRWPHVARGRRNANTMGHSADAVLAVLDLSHHAFARRTTLTVDGSPQRPVRVAGLVPFTVALQQTQAGLACGRVATARHDGGGALTTWTTGLTTPWLEERLPGRRILRQVRPERTIQLDYRATSGHAELETITVLQPLQPAPALHLRFQPAVPDLRQPFDGTHTSRWVLDVNGQPSHAVGALTVSWTDAHRAALTLTAEAPAWAADRPMTGTLELAQDRAELTWWMDGSSGPRCAGLP